MDFQKPLEQLNYSCPDFDAPESEKENPEWSRRYLRWISTHYNRPYATWNPDATTENYMPVERGILNSLYYIGKQKNINYNHLTQDTNGNSLAVTWIKTKKVKPLIDRLCGDLIKQLGAKEISATSLSKRAKSEKMKLMEDIMIQYDSRIKNKLDEIEARFGVKYVAPLSDKYNSQQEAEEYLTYSFKDDLEQVATDLGKYVEFSNDFDTTLIECFRQDYCPANYMAIYYYVEGGKLKSKRVPFYNLIMDISSDDPFMRDGKFVGIMERLTTLEIFKRFPNLSGKEKDEIKELTKEGAFRDNFFAYYNQGGLDWWTARRNDVTAICLTGYWVCQRDTGMMYAKDKYGTKKYVKSVKKGEVIYDLYKATMVGNYALVDHGYDDNVVRSIGNKADPEMPVKIFQGNTTLGEGISPIGLITDLIDFMDALDFKIREMMGKHKGKGYIINGSRLSSTSKDFIQNMSTLGVDVVYPSGEGSPTDNMPLVYPIDMTLDDSIVKYSEYYYQLERRIESYLNLNLSALGQQSAQIGLGVQKQNIAMSDTGNMGLYRNLFKFNEICLQYSINLAKIVYGSGKADEQIMPMVVGDRGLKVLDIIKKYKFEDVLVEISPRDVITDEIKARIHGMAQAFAQNGQMSKMDWLRSETAETLTELTNDWEKAEIKMQEREDAQAQSANDAKMQAIEANNAGQQQTVGIQDQTKKEISKGNNITKIGIEDMKQQKSKQK